MAEKKPKPIFPTSKDMSVHVIHKYGSKLGSGSRVRKYQSYTSKKGTFGIALPVKANIHDVGGKSAQNENCALVQFTETIGIFKKDDYMLISGFSAPGAIDFNSLTKAESAGFVLGYALKNEEVKVVFGSGLAPSSGVKPSIHSGSVDPTDFVDYSNGRDPNAAPAVPAAPTGTSDPSNPDSGSGVDIGSIAKAAAFSTFFQMPGIFDTAESQSLTGQRSLMNDQPLLPFIEQLCGACLRQFMSTPSGDFFAFYPDYFGGLGKTAYWLIADIEIISGSIELSDEQLTTHVYVVGDIAGAPATAGVSGDNQVNLFDKMGTTGVVTVFNAFMADFLNGTDQPAGIKVDSSKYPTLAEKSKAIAFLQKYGARPSYEDQITVRAPIYESFLAYQKFCLKWAEQFQTNFEFTFMPELFPGGIVAFPEHGLQCYVASVTHNCSYENGFTTTAELMAPSAYRGADGTPVDPDKSWVHAGMIRSWPVDPNVTHFTGTTETDPAATTTPATAPSTG